MKKKKIFGLERNVFWLGLTSLFNDASSEMILSILPAFFISVLKSGAQSLGMVEGIADAAANFIKIYSGRLSDKLEKRKIFAVFGYSLSVASRPFYLIAGSVGGVVGIRLADRLGKGVREAPRDVLISLSTSQAEAGKSFGYHRAMDTLGAILGPLVAYLILSLMPGAFTTVFLVSFGVGILALFSLFLVKEVSGIMRREKRVSTAFSSFPRSFKSFLLAIFVLSLGSLPLGVLLFRTGNIGLAIASIPLFYAIYNFTYAAFSLPAGLLADRLGNRSVIIFGYLVLLLGYAVLASSNSALVLVAGFLLMGIYSALTDGVQRSYVAKLVGEESRGSAYGWFNATTGFGALFAGFGGGFVWQNYGDIVALEVGMATVAIGILIFGLIHRRN